MKIRSQLLMVACLIALAGPVYAQPGTAFVETRGGVFIPVGNFGHRDNTGGAYSIAAGYEFLEFFDWLMEFTHAFTDADNFRESRGGFTFVADETHQTFITSTGPRINFLPSHYRVRPYMLFQVGWYHFAQQNSITFLGETLLDDDDRDAVGIQGGLGIDGTVLQVYERQGDEIPLVEMTLGVHAAFHRAFLSNSPDFDMITTMASLGVRF
jgi:hypothetical protein